MEKILPTHIVSAAGVVVNENNEIFFSEQTVLDIINNNLERKIQYAKICTCNGWNKK